jgi:hypothetical protein
MARAVPPCVDWRIDDVRILSNNTMVLLYRSPNIEHNIACYFFALLPKPGPGRNARGVACHNPD